MSLPIRIANYLFQAPEKTRELYNSYVNADLLVLLSDIDGLYTADPHQNADAKLIPEVREITEEIRSAGGGRGSLLGTGGMKTKLHAAELCMESGVDMVILNGAAPELIYELTDGKSVGTRFYAKEKQT